jgi:hypothetical protein
MKEVPMHVFEKSRAAVQAPQTRPAARAPESGRPAVAEGAGSAVWLALRVLGALSLLAIGAVHLQQYYDLYSGIPTIGTLFALNFAGATAIGLGLLAPLEHLLGGRARPPGYDPTAILASRVAEAVTVVLLGSFLVAAVRNAEAARRW